MREIKFRAWQANFATMMYSKDFPGESPLGKFFGVVDKYKMPLMQFTGLYDKNGLTNIYEGDILDENGLVKGNVYESPQIFREGIDCIITGMGTSAWRSSESIAMGRGCKYTE